MRKFGPKIMLTKKATADLLAFFLAFSIVGCVQNSVPPEWKPPEKAHSVADSDAPKMLWLLENVYIENTASVGLAISNDKVLIVGSMDVKQPSKLNALDIFTGELIWKSKSRALFPIIADEGGVYVEGEGPGSVKKYDPDSGEVLWSRNFWTAGGVMHLIIYEGNLHAYLSPDKHKVLRTSDGKTLFSLFPKNPPFFDSRVCGIPYQTPIYTDDSIYYRENETLLRGEVCAVDISTGKLRWKSDLVVISNVVASEDAIFVLVEDGNLLALDPTNGKAISELSISFDNELPRRKRTGYRIPKYKIGNAASRGVFDPDRNKPFIPSSVRSASGNFFLAHDALNNIIVIYLGDSRQLFAFHIQ